VSTAAKPFEYAAFPHHALEQPEWYAIHTRSRHEKKVETELKRNGLESFLPMVSQVRQWTDRKVQVDFPLFPGYVFVRMNLDPKNHLRVLHTNGVVTILGTGGRPTAIPEYQIESTQKLVSMDAAFESHPFLTVGQRVRVSSGALEGVEGVLLAADGQRRIVVSVDLIRQSLAVSLNGYEVEAV
jgi:transcription termination/antitermination protein NusG